MKNKNLIVSAIVVLIGIGLMVIPFHKVKVECAESSARTSGFVDTEKNCPISIESYSKKQKEDSRFKIERVVGLALVIGGVVMIIKNRKKS